MFAHLPRPTKVLSKYILTNRVRSSKKIIDILHAMIGCNDHTNNLLNVVLFSNHIVPSYQFLIPERAISSYKHKNKQEQCNQILSRTNGIFWFGEGAS